MYCIHLFSAAHCLKVSSYSNDTLRSNVLMVSFGPFSSRRWRENETLNREVLGYTIHPDYVNRNTADSDLAILTLRMPVEYNSFIKPICLWSGSIDLQNVVSKIGYVVGWGIWGGALGRDLLGNLRMSEPRIARAPIVSQVRIFIDSEPVFSLFVSFAIRHKSRISMASKQWTIWFLKNKSSETWRHLNDNKSGIFTLPKRND